MNRPSPGPSALALHSAPTCLLLGRLIVAALAILPPAIVAQELSPGLSVLAELPANAALFTSPGLEAAGLPGGVLAARHGLSASEPGRYRVELLSHDFDTWLVVLDATGQIVAEDDDGWLATHSRLMLELPGKGPHEIVVCSLDGTAGSYQLTLAQGEPAVLTTLQQAAALRADRESRVQHAVDRHGLRHAATGAALNLLGETLGNQGDLDGCEKAHALALQIREQVLGGDHLDTAISLNNVAVVAYRRGDVDRARELFGRALASLERIHGQQHPEVAGALNNVAKLDELVGDLDAAQRHHEQALGIYEATVGPNHPDTARSLSNLGLLMDRLGQRQESRQLHERALAIREAQLGPLHTETAVSVGALGAWELELGDLDRALPLLERSLEIHEQTVGPRHWETALALNNLGALHSYRGDLSAARPLFERALSIREEVFGPGHLKTGRSLLNLGQLLDQQGDHERGTELLARSLQLTEQALGSEHVETARCRNNLAQALVNRGDAAAALPLQRDALAVFERTRGKDHPDAANALGNLGRILQNLGQEQEALQLFTRSAGILVAAHGDTHPMATVMIHNRGRSLRRLGQHDAARGELDRGLAASEELWGAGHPSTTRARQELAMLALDTGDPGEALALLSRGTSARRAWLDGIMPLLGEAERFRLLAGEERQLRLLVSAARALDEPAAWDEVHAEVLFYKGRVGRSLSRQAQLAADGGDVIQQAAADLREVQSRLAAVALGSAAVRRNLQAGDLAQLRDEREATERRLLEAMSQTSTPSPQHPAPSAKHPTQLRAALPAHAALIDLLVVRTYESPRDSVPGSDFGSARVVAWVSSPGAPAGAYVDLGDSEELLQAWNDQRSAWTQATASRGRPLGRPRTPRAHLDLSARLWQPLEALVGDASLVMICPDGWVGAVAFSALRSADGRFALEQRAFVAVENPQELPEVLATVPTPQYGALLAVGGVSAPEPWLPLPGTLQEVDALRTLHASAQPQGRRLVLQGEAATAPRLMESLPGSQLVHLATHGFFHEDGLPSLWQLARGELKAHVSESGLALGARQLEGRHPALLSGLVFTPENDGGLLTAEQLGWVDLSSAELVVLSACDTGLGRSAQGEGLMGLRRSLLVAGARSVVASLWQVPDQDTAQLMESFYGRLLQNGATRIEALRGAQLAVLAKHREQGLVNVSAWGGFMLCGEWR